MVDESILASVKSIIGITNEYDAFDKQLIMDINAVFLTMYQTGIGPDELFSITGADTLWSSFSDSNIIEAIKPYVGYRVQIMFDPPASSVLMDQLRDKIGELEFRLRIYYRNKKE